MFSSVSLLSSSIPVVEGIWGILGNMLICMVCQSTSDASFLQRQRPVSDPHFFSRPLRSRLCLRGECLVYIAGTCDGIRPSLTLPQLLVSKFHTQREEQRTPWLHKLEDLCVERFRYASKSRDFSVWGYAIPDLLWWYPNCIYRWAKVFERLIILDLTSI